MRRPALTIIFLAIGLLGYSQSDKEIIKSITAKGVKIIKPYDEGHPGIYYFTDKKGKTGLWDHSQKQVLIEPLSMMLAYPSEIEKTWMFSSEKWIGVRIDSICSKWECDRTYSQDSTLNKLMFPEGSKLKPIPETSLTEYKHEEVWLTFGFEFGQFITSHRDSKDALISRYKIYGGENGHEVLDLNTEVRSVMGGYLLRKDSTYSDYYDYYRFEDEHFKVLFKNVPTSGMDSSIVQKVLAEKGKVVGASLYDHYIFEKDGKLGLIDFNRYAPKGIVLQPDYDVIEEVEWMHCFMVKDGEIGMYSIEYGISIPPKYKSLQLLGRSTCDQYIAAGEIFYSCKTLDCEGFEGLAMADKLIYDSIYENFPHVTFEVIEDQLIIQNGSQREYQQWDIKTGDGYWVTHYTGQSGVFNLKENQWGIEPKHYSIEFQYPRTFLATPDSTNYRLIYRVLDKDMNIIPEETYFTKIEFGDHLIYVNRSSELFTYSMGQPVKLEKLNHYSWEKRGSFLKIDNWTSDEVFDEYGEWAEDPETHYFNSSLKRIILNEFEVVKCLENDFMIVRMNSAESKINSMKEGDRLFVVYDTKAEAFVTSKGSNYSIEKEGEVSIGNKTYILSELRKEPKVLEKIDFQERGEFIPVELDNQQAKIVAEVFVDKGGREHPEIIEYYMEFDGKRYWIKFADSKVSVASVKALVGQKVGIDGRLLDGLWDTDNPEVQSRVGKYLVLDNIRK